MTFWNYIWIPRHHLLQYDPDIVPDTVVSLMAVAVNVDHCQLVFSGIASGLSFWIETSDFGSDII